MRSRRSRWGLRARLNRKLACGIMFVLLMHHKCGCAGGGGPHQTLFVHAALLSSRQPAALPVPCRSVSVRKLRSSWRLLRMT